MSISDKRLLQLVRLWLSVPLPPSPEGAQEVDLGARLEMTNLWDRAKIKTSMEDDEVETNEAALERQMKTAEEADLTKNSASTPKESYKKLYEQQVQIDLNLRLHRVCPLVRFKIQVYFKIGVNFSKGDELVLSANLRRFELHVQMRTFNLVASSHVGSVTVEMPQFKSLTVEREHLFFVDNAHAEEDCLVKIKYMQAGTTYDARIMRWL